LKTFTVPVTFFPVTSPVSKTFAYLALVFRAHYVICRYMFTAGFQYNFRQITARFSAGRRKQVVVSDMLLFCCSWFKYRFTKLDLVTVGKFCFHFRRVRDSVVDCVNVNPSARVELNHGLRDAQNVCALTKVGTVLKIEKLSHIMYIGARGSQDLRSPSPIMAPDYH